jgi:Ni/Co efflux regulator RcnB
MTQQQVQPPTQPRMQPRIQLQGQPMRGGQMPPPRQHRWGGSVGGQWYGGVNAPGGWNAYRRPTRGWTLPRYWIAPTFFISDYASYGLSQPPYGYNWTRYYDEAILMDQRGRVRDLVSEVDWDGNEGGYAQGGFAKAGYWYPPATITTVTVQSAPVISTTTTEYVDTVTTYTPARRVYHAPKRKWRPPVRRQCSCNCCR